MVVAFLQKFISTSMRFLPRMIVCNIQNTHLWPYLFLFFYSFWVRNELDFIAFTTCRPRKRLKAQHAHWQKETKCLKLAKLHYLLHIYSLVISKNWAGRINTNSFGHFPWTSTNHLFWILEWHKARTKRREHKVAAPHLSNYAQASTHSTPITKASHVCSILLDSVIF